MISNNEHGIACDRLYLVEFFDQETTGWYEIEVYNTKEAAISTARQLRKQFKDGNIVRVSEFPRGQEVQI